MATSSRTAPLSITGDTDPVDTPPDLTRPEESGVLYTGDVVPNYTAEGFYTTAEGVREERTFNVSTRPFRLEEDGLDFTLSQITVTRAS